MRKFSKRERYFVTFCAVCIVCFSGYKFVYLRLSQSYKYNQIRIEALERKYLSHRALAAQEKSVMKSVTNMRSELDKVESRFFSGEKDSLVAAEIQQDIKQICLEHGVKIQSSKVLKSEEMGSYRKINVQVLFEGSITAFQRIIFALKNHQKYFFFPEIEIRVTDMRNPTTIRSTATVSGIMRS
jgi:Tfp pilus assembly protein PilO